MRVMKKLGLVLVFVLCLSLVAAGGCGRTQEPSDETPTPSATDLVTQSPEDSASATPSNAPSETGMPTDSPSAEGPPEGGGGFPGDPDATDHFAADDFSVPAGSAISKSDWLRFIRHEVALGLSPYSASQQFFEAYNFSVMPSAGSGEWQLSFTIVLAYYEPGSKDMFGPWGPETQGVTLIALEQADALTRLDLAFDYQEQDIPGRVTEGLRAQYDYWTAQWNRAASKGLEAIPPVGTRIAATPVVKIPEPFLTRVEGSATVDLDGDGRQEQLTIRYENDDSLTLTAGNAEIRTWCVAPEGAYLVDLDERDGRVEIALTDHGPSSDDITLLYALRDGALEQVGAVSGILFAGDGKGRISTYSRGWQGPLLTWFFNIEYELNEGVVAMMPTRWYASTVPVTLRVDLPLYKTADKTEQGVTLAAGTPATIVLSDVSEWFQLETADGTSGWIRFADSDNLQLPDGRLIPQQDVLDGIVAAD